MSILVVFQSIPPSSNIHTKTAFEPAMTKIASSNYTPYPGDLVLPIDIFVLSLGL